MIYLVAMITVLAFCIWVTLASVVTHTKRIADAQERMASMYPNGAGDEDGEEIKHG